jgi:hypothetical protein
MAWNKIKTNIQIQEYSYLQPKIKTRDKHNVIVINIINYSIQKVFIKVYAQHRKCQLQNQQNNTHKIQNNTTTQKGEWNKRKNNNKCSNSRETAIYKKYLNENAKPWQTLMSWLQNAQIIAESVLKT